MRRILWALAVFVLAAGMLPAAASYSGNATALAEGQAVLDDELVLLQSDGRIVVNDPYTPDDVYPVEWQSPSSGWQYVETGDFNGDGTAEIIALRGGQAMVFDPVVPTGTPAVTFEQVISGQVWELAVTGDIDGDGQDEIILTRTTSEGNTVERLQAYDPNPTGTSWTKVFDAGFGASWRALAAGDVDGDGKDEVAAIRNRGSDHRITIWDPVAPNNWPTIHDRNYNFKWLDITIANTSTDSNNKDEIIVSRGDVLGQLPSFLIFRYQSGSSTLQDVAGLTFYPYFQDLATGDINNNGTDEVFMVRRTEGNSDALIGRTFGPDPIPTFETLRGQDKWNRVNMGDLDGDTRAEVVTMSSNEYRIWWEPEVNQVAESYAGSFITSNNFAVGNLDGTGVPRGPSLALSTTSLEYDLEAGQSASSDVQVTNSGTGGSFSWTASVANGGTWLSVTPGTGSTPGTLTVRINTSNLQTGTYNGTVRVTAQSGILNSPQDIDVSVAVTAPSFSVNPSTLSWYTRQSTSSPSKTVRLYGPDLNWHAGVVPISSVPGILEALDAGGRVSWIDGYLHVEGAGGPEDVPIVDWVDITPVAGTATPAGSQVFINLVDARVPYGLSQVAVVFVADTIASPPAVVVNVSVLSALNDASDLWFVPWVGSGA